MNRIKRISRMSMAASLLTILYASPSTAEIPVRPVPCAQVSSSSNNRVRTFPGKVRACRRVELAFSVSGQMNELFADEGCVIRKGAVIARLDSADFCHALNRAKSHYDATKRAYHRAEQLKEQKVVSEADYDRALAEYQVATADLQIAQKALDDTVLCAPYDGVISQRYVENYQHVRDKQPIVAFHDVGQVEVLIQVPEAFAKQDYEASLGRLQVCLDTDGNQWVDAGICEYKVQADSVTRTYEVAVEFIPPCGMRLLPGMSVSVRSTSTAWSDGPMKTGLLNIPYAAIWGGEDGVSYVWVIPEKGGNPRKQQIETGGLHDDTIDVVHGLQAGEWVATAGLQTLRKSLRVRPMSAGKEGLDG